MLRRTWSRFCIRFLALAALSFVPARLGRADPALFQAPAHNAGTRATATDGLPLESTSAATQASAELAVGQGVQPFQSVRLELASGRELRQFFSALTRAKKHEGQARIVFYGDSHTAPDLITGRLRQALQAEF